MSRGELLGKKCYDHLGGRLGAALLELYLSNGWLTPSEEGKGTVYRLTEKGATAFAEMGLRTKTEQS